MLLNVLRPTLQPIVQPKSGITALKDNSGSLYNVGLVFKVLVRKNIVITQLITTIRIQMIQETWATIRQVGNKPF